MLWRRDTKDASDLEISRLLNWPMDLMKEKVQNLVEQKADKTYKYVIYSAHDDTVLNMLRFLKVDFDWIPFASTVTFELKYSEKCYEEYLKGGKDIDGCVAVSILSNGVPLRFPE
mmetsp:Transcript_34044/g.42009  ORF Transcript_34044/g.42009 Transcript_34044/m.42009 type:complete len:115 (+) Transcript_34044:891-1235(+)